MSAVAPGSGCSVDDWLDWQLALHPREMDLGLERVADVARALRLLPAAHRSVIIAGTNGKGSCAALMETMLRESLRVGTYTSPHIWRYNERIRINGACVDDASLCDAFAAVEAVRGGTSLTYFEYGTLAALWLFAQAEVDVAILEVGLGGRLDAVNIVDAEVALITNIGLDHVDWLGPDRESIGVEKAGVMRAGRPTICTDRQMPASIAAEAKRLDSRLLTIGGAFDIVVDAGSWRWSYPGCELTIDARQGVVAENLAGALGVMYELDCMPAADIIARACCRQARLPGRREQVDGVIPVIYDVGHNVEAIAVLVAELEARPVAGQTHVVLGMLADKPVEAVTSLLRTVGDCFYLAGLDSLHARGLAGVALARRAGNDAAVFAGPKAAFDSAWMAAEPGDRIVVCGSFLTVAETRRRYPTWTM